MADQTSGSIHIAARPEAVMAVISDVEQYPARVESMPSAEIPTCRGDRPETVRMVLDHPSVQDDHVLRSESGSAEASGRLEEAQLLRTLDGSCTVEPRGAGSSVTHRLTVDADLLLTGMSRRTAEPTILDGALRGLRRRVEG